MLSLKTLRATGMTALLLATSATTALAADMLGAPPPPPVPMAAPILGGDSGFYLRGDVGYGVYRGEPKTLVRGAIEESTVFSNKKLGNSGIIDVGVGYQANSWLRGDVTVEYRSAAKYGMRETITVNNPAPSRTDDGSVYVNDQTGRAAHIVALVNAYVDLGTWNRITPYVGAGVGMRSTHFQKQRDVAPLPPPAPGAGSDGFSKNNSHPGLAWALHAGAAYDLGSNWKLDFGYRYLNMGTAKGSTFSCRAGSAISPNPNPYFYACQTVGNSFAHRLANLGAHDFRIGMRYTFGESTPAPAYAPGPLVRKY